MAPFSRRSAVSESCRSLLKECLAAALARVDGEICVGRALVDDPLEGPVRVVAVGKAADAMMRGAMDALGGNFREGLLIPKANARFQPLTATDQLSVFPASHPVPDQSSLDAGQALVDFVARVTEGETLLVLVSGGASSLAEVLVDPVTLDELTAFNQYLLGSGLDITQCNALRGRLSLIKAGGLLRYAGTSRITGMMISDVPGDDPTVIGSGLLSPQPSGPVPDEVPAKWRELLDQAPTPVRVLAPAKIQVIASNGDARQAIIELANSRGVSVGLADGVLAGDAQALGNQIGEFLSAAAPGLYIWGGETTVVLPATPGRGGRNQHLALAAAIALAGSNGVSLLACGSDGNDGPGNWAGAMVDGQTLARGAAADCDAHDCLRRADAGRFLLASGDLLQTGPTGTNVSDLVLALVCAPEGELR